MAIALRLFALALSLALALALAADPPPLPDDCCYALANEPIVLRRRDRMGFIRPRKVGSTTIEEYLTHVLRCAAFSFLSFFFLSFLSFFPFFSFYRSTTVVAYAHLLPDTRR